MSFYSSSVNTTIADAGSSTVSSGHMNSQTKVVLLSFGGVILLLVCLVAIFTRHLTGPILTKAAQRVKGDSKASVLPLHRTDSNLSAERKDLPLFDSVVIGSLPYARPSQDTLVDGAHPAARQNAPSQPPPVYTPPQPVRNAA